MGEGGALPDQSRQFSTQPVTDPPIKQYVQYGPSRALFGGALLVCLGCLLALSIRNLLFRFVLDPRHEISTAALEAAVTRFPDSALLNRLWAEVRGSTDPSTVPLLWNGGFEGPHDPVHPHFDWQFKSSEFVQVGLDPRVFAEGRYSLQLRLTGRDTTRIEDEVRQRVVLSPGGKYRLSCLVQTRDLQTPRGPQLVVRWNGRPLGASEPLPAGTTDGWQRLFFDFQVPTESGTTEIAVIRTPKYSYDDPSRGLIWLDDLRLVAIESSPQQGGQP